MLSADKFDVLNRPGFVEALIPRKRWSDAMALILVTVLSSPLIRVVEEAMVYDDSVC